MELHTAAKIDDHLFIFPHSVSVGNEIQRLHVTDNGLQAVLAVLAYDTDAQSPFKCYDAGQFILFDDRVGVDYFKRLVRQYPNYISLIDKQYFPDDPLTVNDTKGKRPTKNLADSVGSAVGYFIAPDDVPTERVKKYTEAVFRDYRDYLDGECYGVCVWEYARQNINSPWELLSRDNECWGYYGHTYAMTVLNDEFNSTIK